MLEGPHGIRNSGYLVINYPVPGSHGWAVLERWEVTSALDGGLPSRVTEPHLAGQAQRAARSSGSAIPTTPSPGV